MIYNCNELRGYLKSLGFTPTTAGHLTRSLSQKYDKDSYYCYGVIDPIEYPTEKETIKNHLMKITEYNFQRYRLGPKGLAEVLKYQENYYCELYNLAVCEEG